jgi:hypothetical protein
MLPTLQTASAMLKLAGAQHIQGFGVATRACPVRRLTCSHRTSCCSAAALIVPIIATVSM